MMRRPSSSNPNASQLPKRTSLSRTAKIKAGSAIKRDLKRKNENGTVKLETERNNRRRHTKTDETAKSSAASVATNNSSTSCTDASQDLQLERENSAWDTLGERFFLCRVGWEMYGFVQRQLDNDTVCVSSARGVCHKISSY
jgi:hypothetical protein